LFAGDDGIVGHDPENRRVLICELSCRQATGCVNGPSTVVVAAAASLVAGFLGACIFHIFLNVQRLDLGHEKWKPRNLDRNGLCHFRAGGTEGTQD
jgi:hypothetical protein